MRRWIAFALPATALLAGVAVYFAVEPDSRQLRTDTNGFSVSSRLLGRILNEAAEPLNGATLCAYGSESTNRLERACASIDARGTYVLDLAPGQYEITASAPHFASAHAKVTLIARQEQRLDLKLDPQPPTLTGIVKSAAGFAIADAEIKVFEGERVISNVNTNDAGVFNVWTPPGKFLVSAEAKGFAASSVRTVAPASDIRITLFPGSSVSGQVLLEESLRPVANVRITALRSNDRVASATRDSMTRSDSKGHFRFPNLGPGEWTLTVAENHLWGTLPSPVQVTLDQSVDNITLLVRPASPVTGRFVVGDKSETCPSGILQLNSESAVEHLQNKSAENTSTEDANASPTLIAEVQSDGEVAFDAVPYGSYRLGPVCKEHRFARGPTKLEVGREQTTDLVWNFDRGAEVSVLVIDELRKPVAQAIVTLAPVGNADFSQLDLLLSRHSGTTDSKGSYHVGGLREGSYEVSARYAALNGNRTVQEKIEVSAEGNNITTLTLPAAGVIQIHAHDSATTPVSRMLFFAINESGVRYEGNFVGDGRFVIGPMPQDNYRVYAYDNKNAKIPLNNGRAVFVQGGEPVDLDFNYEAPTAYLEGRIVDSNGAPVSEALVRAVSTTLDQNDERFSGIQVSMHGAQELMTDRDGRFRIEGLIPGATYDLYIDHRTGLQDVRRGVSPGGFLNIELPAGATIRGRVITAKSKAFDAFDVLVQNAATKTNRSLSFANTDGQFKIENIPPGHLHIVVFDRTGSLSVQQDAFVSPGQIFDTGQLTLNESVRDQTGDGAAAQSSQSVR